METDLLKEMDRWNVMRQSERERERLVRKLFRFEAARPFFLLLTQFPITRLYEL